MNPVDVEYLVRPMGYQDIKQASKLEKEAFPTQWPPTSFEKELKNRLAHYYVTINTKATYGDNKNCSSPPNIITSKTNTNLFSKLKSLLFGKRPEIIPGDKLVVAFVGLWFMVDEAHIINIAVRNSQRGKGLGELMMIAAIEKSISLNAARLTLEVRASNYIAQHLYHKYGFVEAGLRRGYYSDNHEDAIIMTTDRISSALYLDEYNKLKIEYFKKYPDYSLSPRHIYNP